MQNAKIDLIKKFLNYANCADAAYAKLDFVFENVDSIFPLFENVQ